MLHFYSKKVEHHLDSMFLEVLKCSAMDFSTNTVSPLQPIYFAEASSCQPQSTSLSLRFLIGLTEAFGQSEGFNACGGGASDLWRVRHCAT